MCIYVKYNKENGYQKRIKAKTESPVYMPRPEEKNSQLLTLIFKKGEI